MVVIRNRWKSDITKRPVLTSPMGNCFFQRDSNKRLSTQMKGFELQLARPLASLTTRPACIISQRTRCSTWVTAAETRRYWAHYHHHHWQYILAYRSSTWLFIPPTHVTLEICCERGHPSVVRSVQSSLSRNVRELPLTVVDCAASRKWTFFYWRFPYAVSSENGTQASISQFSWMPSAILHAVYVNNVEILYVGMMTVWTFQIATMCLVNRLTRIFSKKKIVVRLSTMLFSQLCSLQMEAPHPGRVA